MHAITPYRQDRILRAGVLGHEEVCTTDNNSCLHNIDWCEAQPRLHVAAAAVELDKDQADEAGKEQTHSNEPPVSLHITTYSRHSAAPPMIDAYIATLSSGIFLQNGKTSAVCDTIETVHNGQLNARLPHICSISIHTVQGGYVH